MDAVVQADLPTGGLVPTRTATTATGSPRVSRARFVTPPVGRRQTPRPALPSFVAAVARALSVRVADLTEQPYRGGNVSVISEQAGVSVRMTTPSGPTVMV